jgi:BASS family bile acid:Na+ symporter
MQAAEVLRLALQGSIMLTVFGFGLRATIEDVVYLLRRPRMLIISLVSMFIVMPFVALILALVFEPPQVTRVALVALALSPVPPILLTRERKAGGNASYGLGLMVTVSILSIGLVPALVVFLGMLIGRPFQLGPAAVAGQVLAGVAFPLTAGMLVQRFLPRLAHRVEKPVALVANVVLLAAAAVLLITTFGQIGALLTLETLAALVLFTVLGLAFGHILAGPHPGDSATLALSSALRHPGIAFAIAGASFPSLDVGALIILYLLISAIVCIPYIKRMQKRGPVGRSEM